MEGFARTLREHGLNLARGQTQTLQVNVGLVCNQACGHCHLEAGPGRTEIMDPATMAQVVEYAGRGGFEVADITGGAPELNPYLDELLLGLRPLVKRLMLRANLTALALPQNQRLWGLLKDNLVVLVASFSSLNQGQADAQRGTRVFETSLNTLRRLNDLGYGSGRDGLELNLVANPAGAFLPPAQEAAEKRLRGDMARKWGVSFDHLYNFANAPLGRFRAWLERTGNLEDYLAKLAGAFNPCAVEGLMCRSLVSVSWDGHLYDCDFNLAAGLPLGGRPTHVSQLKGPPEPGAAIMVGDHCYTCAAGAGFT